MSFYNLFSEKIVLPFSDLYTNQSVAEKLKFLLKSKSWNRQQIDEFQNARLRNLIKHAYTFVPYYQQLFNSLGLLPEDIQTKGDLYKLPLLTKAIIRKEKETFISSGIPIKNKIKRSSSGSTGEPLFYWTTKEAYSMNIAANLRGWYEMGFRLGDKYIKMSQNGRKSSVKRLQDYISRNKYIKADPLNDENFERILKEIEVFKPKVIRCYPDPLLFLARYKQRHPEFTYSPNCINTTGNTLHVDTRKEIEEAFHCKIFDSYSSEGNSCVFECNTHTCYHSSEEYGISEILDENGNQIIRGVGRLISTDLWNNVHPFIRYDTQDYVEMDNEPCSCGKSHLKIKRILGRDNEILNLSSGKKFIVHNFTIFFSIDSKELQRSIDQFQVVKKKDDKVLFRLIVNRNYNEQIGAFIKSSWSSQFQTDVDIELVNHIPLTVSGKRKFVINEQ